VRVRGGSQERFSDEKTEAASTAQTQALALGRNRRMAVQNFHVSVSRRTKPEARGDTSSLTLASHFSGQVREQRQLPRSTERPKIRHKTHGHGKPENQKKTGGTCHESSITEETMLVRRKGSFQPATVLVA
jgi:hypothetical protein